MLSPDALPTIMRFRPGCIGVYLKRNERKMVKMARMVHFALMSPIFYHDIQPSSEYGVGVHLKRDRKKW